MHQSPHGACHDVAVTSLPAPRSAPHAAWRSNGAYIGSRTPDNAFPAEQPRHAPTADPTSRAPTRSLSLTAPPGPAATVRYQGRYPFEWRCSWAMVGLAIDSD